MNQEITFGEAIEALKADQSLKATRSNWLNKNRYIEIDKGFFNSKSGAQEAEDIGTFLEIESKPVLHSIFGIKPNLFIDIDCSTTVLPSITHVLKDRNVSSNYVATHEDILASDWRLL